MKFDFSAADLNAMTPEQRVNLLSGDFSRWKMIQAAKYIVPFWWVEPQQSPFQITQPVPLVRNGTAFFADIGNELFCITAAHVYRGYLEAKKHYPNLQCRLGEGDLIFNPEANIHSIGGLASGKDKVDIATFRIERKTLLKMGKESVFANISGWPPPHPFSGQEGTLIGYPNSLKQWTGVGAINFGIYCGSSPVGTASDRRITIPFERQNWLDALGHGLPPEGLNLGGISGGPLLILSEQKRDWFFSVGGVISEMPQSLGFETVVIEPAHFIGPDGVIMNENSAPLQSYLGR